MQPMESNFVRAGHRVAGLEQLLAYTPVDDADTRQFLNAILDNFATPEGRWAMWEKIRERQDWLDAVNNGADVDGEDPELVAAQTEQDLRELLHEASGFTACGNARPPVRVAA